MPAAQLCAADQQSRCGAAAGNGADRQCGARTPPWRARIELAIGPAPLMTALNMNGFSLSLIKLDAEREAALPSAGRARMHGRRRSRRIRRCGLPAPKAETPAAVGRPSQERRRREVIARRLRPADRCSRRSSTAWMPRPATATPASTVATGARSVLARLGEPAACRHAGDCCGDRRSLATAWAVRAACCCRSSSPRRARRCGDGAGLADALLAGLERMTFYGGAQPGDRTMVDALSPALHALASGRHCGLPPMRRARAPKPPRQCARRRPAGPPISATSDLEGVMDPGAHAVAEVFAAVAKVPEPA